ADDIVSPEFKGENHDVILIEPRFNSDGLPETASLLKTFARVTDLLRSKKAVACYTPCMGGIADAIMKMCFGNGVGFAFDAGIPQDRIFARTCACFILELADGQKPDFDDAVLLGRTNGWNAISYHAQSVSLSELLTAYESKLEPVFPSYVKERGGEVRSISFRAGVRPAPAVKTARPKVLIPAFPGTNCEYDSAKVMRDAGAEPEIFVVNNLTSDGIARSVETFAKMLKEAQMVFIPGGFSGGDEPDGSGKLITAFFRSAAVKERVTDLLDKRGGLMCGICNGFQALIKLGLVPYGKIIDTDADCPTLTFNTIGRHQSRIVRTRIASNKSPWLALTEVGDIYSVPISHGEGRFLADDPLIAELEKNGQIATQYVDLDGRATDDILFNPNGSVCAIEGITSPDGRVFGKMGHAERIGSGLYQNVPGNYDIHMFEAAVRYFKSC
ncbi:MAG: phosphoribosylformylglycinamidine synthase subunit PurQ, partial [Oscillospiraceae bacterium]|nr:phosphoribosylformylglycinamidine synthase subunit PurQ [Oscillospiraceae bacterium]